MPFPPNLALAFATIERPQVAQRLIRSARTHLKSIPIYVADQSRDVAPMEPFYAASDARLVRMPFDIGVTASRNRLAREIKEDYFVLCDDDFVIGPETRFDDAIRILDVNPDIGVVGGRLYDFDGREERTRNWEIYLEYDPRQRLLFSIPIYELAPRAREVEGVRFYLCDAVLNFSVMRRDMFLNGVAWDERFKSNGEHEDFFLALKLNSNYRVVYLPTMIAYHHHPEEYSHYRRRLRDRNEGWLRFFEKWGLDQHLEFGLGVRSIDDVSVITGAQTARDRFFLNADLCLQRDVATPDKLLVDREGAIATVGALDEMGVSLWKDRPGFGSVLLERGSRVILAASPAEAPRIDENTEDATRFEKYFLETSARRPAVSFADGEIYFRYDTILRPDRDFVVWYYRRGDPSKSSGQEKRLAVVVRWVADDGAILIWRSRRTFLDLQAAGYWRPVLIETPLPPPKLKWLRFEIVSDGEAHSDPVCTGFLFSSSQAQRQTAPAIGAGGVEALGLSRLVKDGATPGQQGQTLDDFGRKGQPFPVEVEALDDAPDLSLLSLVGCEGLEVLFFQAWESLGRSLVSSRLPPREIPGPRRIAIPRVGWGEDKSRIYGFGRRLGLVSLRRSAPASGCAT